jgi:hypothetical protein
VTRPRWTAAPGRENQLILEAEAVLPRGRPWAGSAAHQTWPAKVCALAVRCRNLRNPVDGWRPSPSAQALLARMRVVPRRAQARPVRRPRGPRPGGGIDRHEFGAYGSAPGIWRGSPRTSRSISSEYVRRAGWTAAPATGHRGAGAVAPCRGGPGTALGRPAVARCRRSGPDSGRLVTIEARAATRTPGLAARLCLGVPARGAMVRGRVEIHVRRIALAGGWNET